MKLFRVMRMDYPGDWDEVFDVCVLARDASRAMDIATEGEWNHEYGEPVWVAKYRGFDHDGSNLKTTEISMDNYEGVVSINHA